MSTATQKAKMSSRHVLLIITGIMLTFGCSALTFSTWTNFQPVVSEAMGMVTSTGAIDTAPFALYITVLYLTMTVVSPMAGKLIQKMDIRIILSVSAALVGIAFILMSIYTEINLSHLSTLPPFQISPTANEAVADPCSFWNISIAVSRSAKQPK